MIIPKGYNPSTPVPLVLALHPLGGQGNSGEQFLKAWHLDELADSKGFLLVAPNGIISKEGRFWNATDACCDFYGTGVDDVAYLTSIIAEVLDRFLVDAKRIYIVGYSAGGAMAHRMACDASIRVAAIVSMAAAGWNDGGRCKPASPVAILEVHGTADEVVLYDGGGPVRPDAGTYPAAVDTIDAWATRNGCSGSLTKTDEGFHLDARKPEMKTTVARHGGCPAGASVELWTMNGTAHYTELSPSWPEAMWAFLAANPTP